MLYFAYGLNMNKLIIIKSELKSIASARKQA